MTGLGRSCNASVLDGVLYSDWQQVFESSAIQSSPSGSIVYVEINADAPGFLCVGVSDSTNRFVGFVASSSPSSLGLAVVGSVEDVTVQIPPAKRKRITGGGSGGVPTEAQLRRLSPISASPSDASGVPSWVNPPTGPVYGASSPSDGRCTSTSTSSTLCQDRVTRWEVRLVMLPTGEVGVWAWAQGRTQWWKMLTPPGSVAMAQSPLTVHAFNANAGTTVDRLYPRLTGVDVRVKRELTFSRVASRIYSAHDMRQQSSQLFSVLPSPSYAVPPEDTSVPCPPISFIASTTVPPSNGYTPLLQWSLSALGIQLAPSSSYDINVNLFFQNLSSVNDTVLLTLYDGQRALGVVTLPPATGVWAGVIGATTPLAPDASLNFPLGAPLASPVTNNPSASMITSNPAYSSRRINLLVKDYFLPSFPSGSAPTPSTSVQASDPEAPLAQIPANPFPPSPARRNVHSSRGGPSLQYPFTPAVSASSRSQFTSFNAASSDLRIVVWASNTDPSSISSTSVAITGMSMVIDSASPACNGQDYGGQLQSQAPVYDACGVCGGNNSTCAPCDNVTQCCQDYNGVSDACWNALLVPQAAANVMGYLRALRSSLTSQCTTATDGTRGQLQCCSQSAWNNATQQMQQRACSNGQFQTSCLQQFQQIIRSYNLALSNILPPLKKK